MVFIGLRQNFILKLRICGLSLLLSLLYFGRKLVRFKKREYEEARGESLQLNILIFYEKLLIVNRKVENKII